MRRLERWGRLLSLLGYALAWIFPNPIAAWLISHGNLNRWMLMHHISHRAYDRIPGIPARYTSRRFAMGWRRFLDWFDWIHPRAWAHEHNVLHHYNTGERGDPDLVERNLAYLRKSRLPRWRRYLHVAFLASTWKLTYYAPSTMHEYQNDRRRRRGELPVDDGFMRLWNPLTRDGLEFWLRCLLPYGVMRFVVVPLLFLPLGPSAAISVLMTSVLAEVMTNVHAFAVIGPNHSGDDLYRFDRPGKDKREFFARQVLGSVNYTTGRESVDWLQAYLNYQIEHHLWPDLPMLKYREVQPRARALCEAHGLPYLQEPILRRVSKLVDIMVGRSSMRRVRSLTSPTGFRAEESLRLSAEVPTVASAELAPHEAPST